jgi:hypothetical protein
VKPTKPPAKPGELARNLIRRQLEHFEKHTEHEFGTKAQGVQRFVLQGIAPAEWSGSATFSVREIDKDQVFASVVHLVAIDLAPTTITVRQVGLDLSNGTVCRDWTFRKPLSSIISLKYDPRRSPATAEWDRMRSLVIEQSRKFDKDPQKKEAQKKQLEDNLKTFVVDEVTREHFSLVCTGGDDVQLTIADQSHARNQRKIAYPIGGKANLDKAIAAWKAIEEARRNGFDIEAKRTDGLRAAIEDLKAKLVPAVETLKQRMDRIEQQARARQAAAEVAPKPPTVEPPSGAQANGHDPKPTMLNLAGQPTGGDAHKKP